MAAKTRFRLASAASSAACSPSSPASPSASAPSPGTTTAPTPSTPSSRRTPAPRSWTHVRGKKPTPGFHQAAHHRAPSPSPAPWCRRVHVHLRRSHPRAGHRVLPQRRALLRRVRRQEAPHDLAHHDSLAFIAMIIAPPHKSDTPRAPPLPAHRRVRHRARPTCPCSRPSPAFGKPSPAAALIAVVGGTLLRVILEFSLPKDGCPPPSPRRSSTTASP